MRDGRVGELMRAGSRLAVIASIGGLAAGCSTDSMRFSESPFGNPFGSQEASAPAEPRTKADTSHADRVGAMPRGTVAAAPLAPVGTPSRGSGANHWTARGGTPITVAAGDTLSAIAGRYGVPPAAILSANGITAAQVVPGRPLTIPVYTAASVSTSAAPAPAFAAQPAPAAARVVSTARLPIPVRPATVAEAPAPRHVRPGTPMRVAAAPVRAEPVQTGSVETKSRLKLARANAPDPAPARVAAIPARTEPAPAQPAPKVGALVRSESLPTKPQKVAKAEPAAAKAAARPEPAPAKVAKAEPAPAPVPAKVAAVAKPAAKALEPQKVAALTAPKAVADAPKAREIESTGALPPAAAAPAATAPSAEFRWPARGRVISGFGGSGSNEGINIAVPDGTPVKAAEAGTVAYAGSEVKGYGNLVLIKHDNGYVSAYAHNGDIEVKRGQRVSRGQVVAKSGQTGNVTSPQIHFEIRKGSTPVDPTPLLASN